MTVVRLNVSGSQQELRGTAEIALDPSHPHNQVITDLALAPREPDGCVHFDTPASP
jgi:hypothetical protein